MTNNDTEETPLSGRSGVIATEGVLFPATKLEYHFQEPARRLLVRQAYVGEGYLVVRSGDEDYETDIATLAEIASFEEPSEDRTVVVLEGKGRVTIDEIEKTDRFVAAEWSWIDEPVEDEEACRELAGDIIGALRALSEAGVEMAGEVADQAEEADSAAAVADIVGSVTFETIDEQREHLEATAVGERLRRVEERLAELVE